MTAAPGAASAASTTSATSIPAALAPIEILYPPPAATLPKTILTALFHNLGLKYDKWNCYQRGLGLYSELSSSIHKYNKQFEVEETNWGRSDFLILKWLRLDVDEDGAVGWKDARVERNMPFTAVIDFTWLAFAMILIFSSSFSFFMEIG